MLPSIFVGLLVCVPALSWMPPQQRISSMGRSSSLGREDFLVNPLPFNFVAFMATDPTWDDDGREESVEQPAEASMTPPPSPPPRMPSPPPPMVVSQRSSIDPLVNSMTRNDRDPRLMSEEELTTTANLPFVGEITLNQDSFVIIPIAAFAVLGFISFLVVAFNSRDSVLDTVNEWTSLLAAPAPQPVYDPNACRGLCSSQEADLESMRTFMKSLEFFK